MQEKYQFRVAQKALIKDGKKFLIIKRSPKAEVFPEHWDLPGGKLEHGEDYVEGLKREALEETGLTIKIGKPFSIYVETTKAFAYVVVFECNLESGKVLLSSEHTEFKWATKEEILLMKVEPYLRNALAKI
ncbi:MAG: NUDIX domain-containing protein [archaeon]|jgi:8-oxo-dGTP diphosphatase